MAKDKEEKINLDDLLYIDAIDSDLAIETKKKIETAYDDEEIEKIVTDATNKAGELLKIKKNKKNNAKISYVKNNENKKKINKINYFFLAGAVFLSYGAFNAYNLNKETKIAQENISHYETNIANNLEEKTKYENISNNLTELKNYLGNKKALNLLDETKSEISAKIDQYTQKIDYNNELIEKEISMRENSMNNSRKKTIFSSIATLICLYTPLFYKNRKKNQLKYKN
ncbi:MAG: hypothetical protein ACOC3X_00580 [Nanoarchaeota archaeon]